MRKCINNTQNNTLQLSEEKINSADKDIIFETEFQFNTETVVKMTIFENSLANSNNMKNNDSTSSTSSTYQYTEMISDLSLTNTKTDGDSENKWPKKVRFGGEIIKLRTPESTETSTILSSIETIDNISESPVFSDFLHTNSINSSPLFLSSSASSSSSKSPSPPSPPSLSSPISSDDIPSFLILSQESDTEITTNHEQMSAKSSCSTFQRCENKDILDTSKTPNYNRSNNNITLDVRNMVKHKACTNKLEMTEPIYRFRKSAHVLPYNSTILITPIIQESLIRCAKTKKIDQKIERAPSLPTFSISKQPFDLPVMGDIIRQLKSSNWAEIVNGMTEIQNHMIDNFRLVMPHLCVVSPLILTHLKSPRSLLIKKACETAQIIFTNGPYDKLHAEVEELFPILINRSVDTNQFIRHAADEALKAIPKCINLLKLSNIILSHGFKNVNKNSRARVANMLLNFVREKGHIDIFKRKKEHLIPFLIVICKLLIDNSPDTRKYSRELLEILVKNSQFMNVYLRSLPSHIVKPTSKIILDLAQK